MQGLSLPEFPSQVSGKGRIGFVLGTHSKRFLRLQRKELSRGCKLAFNALSPVSVLAGGEMPFIWPVSLPTSLSLSLLD